MSEFRDKNTGVRINSKLYQKFRETVEIREKDRFKKTSLSDLLEIAVKDYINKK